MSDSIAFWVSEILAKIMMFSFLVGVVVVGLVLWYYFCCLFEDLRERKRTRKEASHER